MQVCWLSVASVSPPSALARSLGAISWLAPVPTHDCATLPCPLSCNSLMRLPRPPLSTLPAAAPPSRPPSPPGSRSPKPPPGLAHYLKPGLTPAPPVSVGLSPFLSPTLFILPLRIPLWRCTPGFACPTVVGARDIVRTIGPLSLGRPAGLPVRLGIGTTARHETILGIDNPSFAVHSQTFGDGLPPALYFPGFEVN